MSAQHTPGPWAVDDDFTSVYISAPGKVLRVARIIDGAGEAETLANARLIAAAPELLAAVQAVELARMTDEAKHWDRATKLTDAAIAKAIGA